VLADEFLNRIRNQIADEHKLTQGPWLTSPTHDGARVHTPDGATILEGKNFADIHMAVAGRVFLAELVEEVVALRALEGDHYKRAGLQRTLTSAREIRNLNIGAIIVDSDNEVWRSVKRGKTTRWINQNNPQKERLSSDFGARRVKVVDEN
jgi:hypothetical protein